MKIVYLPNGQACYLKEMIGEKYIVNKIFEYQDEEGEWQETHDPGSIVVDAVFDAPPIEKIDAQVKALQIKKAEMLKELETMERDKRMLKVETENLAKTQISNSKFILNKTELINAKELVMFPEHEVEPIRHIASDKKNFRGIELSMEVRLTENEERYWGYKLYFDDGYDSGRFLCKKYGVQIDPTPELVEEIYAKRIKEINFSDSEISRVDDKYLSESQIERKVSYHKKEKENALKYAEKQYLEAKAKLDALNGNL